MRSRGRAYLRRAGFFDEKSHHLLFPRPLLHCVASVVSRRYREDKCLITPTDGSPTPCYKKGDLCMMQNMYDALWLSFATISTVGYGDIYPQTSLGKGFAMLAALAGTIYLAMPLTIIGTRFYDVYEEYNKFVRMRVCV